MTKAAVYDDPPDVPAGLPDDRFPYVVIGEGYEMPNDADDILGTRSLVVIRIWSRYSGMKEIKEIFDEIYTLLHRKSGSVLGWTVRDTQLLYSQFITHEDGLTRSAYVQFNVFLYS
ncbi:DUF3168 domain-containing protein [Candidatus Parcubacteria bacterium]|nr:MAG: DUF3168 domain-containing protein [Candidatus Parcubacteria bacterium]